MGKEVQVSSDGGYALWELWMNSQSEYHRHGWDEESKARVRASLKPGAKIISMFALSVHVLQANGTVEVIEAERPFEASAPDELSDGHLWADNGPRADNGQRYAVIPDTDKLVRVNWPLTAQTSMKKEKH